MVQFSNQLQALFEDAPPISGQITFRLYDVAGEKLTLWLDDETVDAYFGGALSVRKDIAATTELTYNGGEGFHCQQQLSAYRYLGLLRLQ